MPLNGESNSRSRKRAPATVSADMYKATFALLTRVPRRKNTEILAGKGRDREEAARISGFADPWKAQQEPQSVRDVYASHDVFASRFVVHADELLTAFVELERAIS